MQRVFPRMHQVMTLVDWTQLALRRHESSLQAIINFVKLTMEQKFVEDISSSEGFKKKTHDDLSEWPKKSPRYLKVLKIQRNG